jgi:hypothetical protein
MKVKTWKEGRKGQESAGNATVTIETISPSLQVATTVDRNSCLCLRRLLNRRREKSSISRNQPSVSIVQQYVLSGGGCESGADLGLLTSSWKHFPARRAKLNSIFFLIINISSVSGSEYAVSNHQILSNSLFLCTPQLEQF